MPHDIRKGKKEIADYFLTSWYTAKKHLAQVRDGDIYWYTIAGKPMLDVTNYEAKYGRPRVVPVPKKKPQISLGRAAGSLVMA